MPRTSSRPFGCPICTKGFLTQSAVLKHLRQPNCRCHRVFIRWGPRFFIDPTLPNRLGPPRPVWAANQRYSAAESERAHAEGPSK
ncbi:hypothetical protein C8R44DRAFT_792959 [Mycena epipterygia]|nr:hypothetical protein C8R44DRAFT_792959 [Mycena epipterygia]